MNRGLIRDDFAGPGGWSEGLRLLGLREDYGIEFDATACETARLAGHQRWHVDVTSPTVREHPWSRRWIWLYIASPPCQTFSMAGNGAGRDHMAHLMGAVRLVGRGVAPEEAIARVGDAELDVRSVLVLEPLYVVQQHMPRNVALEQVPPVLPIWEAYAEILREWGYSVWTGYVFSEQYGVPQTRKRAVLMASLDREVHAPTPTHSRYHSRSPQRLDDGVLPWVSMAQALGAAGFTAVSSQSVAGGPRAERDAEQPALTVTSNTDRVVMRSNYGTGGDPAARGERTADEPAPTMTTKAGRNRWLQGNQKPNRVDYQRRAVENPAQTITGETGSFQWIPEAPNGGDTSWSDAQPGSIRVSAQEAGILQSFPADYPWQGRKGKQFEQVGNAVPPVMAAAIIRSLLGMETP